jgi:hypothetical protein
MPVAAVAAGVLGLLGVLPVGYAVLIWIAVDAWSNSGVRWLLCVLFAVPLLQLCGAVLLLARRGRALLVAACALGTLPLLLVAPAVLSGGGARWWAFVVLLLCPPLAFGLAMTEPVRRWLSTRPGAHARPDAAR